MFFTIFLSISYLNLQSNWNWGCLLIADTHRHGLYTTCISGDLMLLVCITQMCVYIYTKHKRLCDSDHNIAGHFVHKIKHFKLPTLLSIFSYFPNERRLPAHVLASLFSKPFSAGCLLACESCSWNWPITGRHRICDTILNAYKLHMNYYE